MTMTLKDYFSLSMKGLMAKPGMVVFTFLAIVVSKWVYYSALNSMGDSVTNEELGNVLIVRLISDFITITVGFLLLFSITKKLVDPMRLGFFKFSFDSTVAGFLSFFAAMVMALLASIVVSAISPDLLSAPVDGQDLSMMTLLTVVSLGGLITFVLVFCWIGILGQCVVNRYLPKEHKTGLWRLRYVLNKKMFLPLMVSALIMLLPPFLGQYFAFMEYGGAGLDTLFQLFSTVGFALSTATGISYIVKVEEAQLREALH